MLRRFLASPALFAWLGMLASLSWADSSTGLFPDPLPAHYRTGRRFAAAMEQPISGSWKGVPLRSILRRLSHEGEVALLLDRRVDPEQPVRIETGDRPLRVAVNEVAQATQLSVTRVGNCLIVAPAAPVLRLRTLIAMREAELGKASVSSPGLDRLRTQRATIAWEDLERPSEIVGRIGRLFGISIAGIDQIPHDLWAGATIPEATASEALSLVLNQFDLTFEWTPREAGVRLVPVPAHIAIERTYALHGKPAGPTLRTLQSAIDGLDAQTRGNKLIVRGTIEQHEMVASLLRGSGGPSSKSKLQSTSIEKQSFQLQAGGVSLRELFVELKKQGLPLEYDASLLKRAGIDLERKVDVDLPRLPAATFLTRLLDPYGLTYRFERGTVVVFPKSSP
jgi:hypothetical protein